MMMSWVEWLLHKFTCVAIRFYMKIVDDLVSADYIEGAIGDIDCVGCVDRADRCG